MTKPFFLTKLIIISILIISLLPACNHYISPYDQFAYTQTTALKVDVLNLIDESTGSYSSHEEKVNEVVSKMMKAIEYEKHRPTNNITIRMWNKLMDSTAQKGIVGAYLSSWKRTGNKSQALIDEFKPIAAEGFDLIAELEAQKIQSSNPSVLNFLNK